jgi:cysteine desulfurase
MIAPSRLGALFVRRKAPFSPYGCGGHQEGNRRGGTENVPLIVGTEKPAELARKRFTAARNT